MGLTIKKPIAVSELLSIDEAAGLIGVTSRSLRRWHQEGRGPAVIVISRRVRLYRRSAVMDWLRSHEIAAGDVA